VKIRRDPSRCDVFVVRRGRVRWGTFRLVHMHRGRGETHGPVERESFNISSQDGIDPHPTHTSVAYTSQNTRLFICVVKTS
jgi:hypothetical protein